MTVSFYSDGTKHIRVEDSATGNTTYFSKANLILQADANSTFFFKSDNFQQYFLYSDVARPDSTDIKHLMTIFQSWIEDAGKDDLAGTPLISDTTSTVLEVKTFFDKDPLKISEITQNDGSTTFDPAMNAVHLDLATTPTSYTVRQTKLYAPILNNKHMYSVVGAVLISDTSATNVRTRVGAFDDNNDIAAPNSVPSGNGIFFQYDSVDGLALVLRSNITGLQDDTIVPQSEWNLDELNGNGPSRLVLDPTEEQTYVFEWSALKGNIIRAGILNDGFPRYCHKFIGVRMGCASVPLRWEIKHKDAALPVASNTTARMTQCGSSVLIEGSQDMPRMSRSVDAPLKFVTSAISPMPIMSMKLRPQSNRASVLPKRVRIINLDAGLAKWSLVLNPSTLTNPTYTDLGSGSFVCTSHSETAVSGGTTLATGFFTDSALQTIELDDKFLPLCSDIAGNGDTLALVVTYLRGVVTVSAVLEWVELE